MAEITGHLSSSAIYQNLWIENICTAHRVPSVPTYLYEAKVREAFLDGPFGNGATPSQGGLSPRVGQVARGRELSWCSASGEALRWAPLARGERMPPCRDPKDRKAPRVQEDFIMRPGLGHNNSAQMHLKKSSCASQTKLWALTRIRILLAVTAPPQGSAVHIRGFRPPRLRSKGHQGTIIRMGHPTLSSQLQNKRENRGERKVALSTSPWQTDQRISC